MNQYWSCDFSYNYFKKSLRAAKANFELYLLSEAPQIIEEPNNRKIILRHDVDVSLRRAYTMAKIEESCGIRASYMVMVESSLYSINDDISRTILGKMVAMKHEIGLHIDPCKCENEPIEEKIDSACNKLENLVRSRVQTVSFHRPPEASLNGPLIIGNKINAYSKKLQGWYMSDSG